MLIGATGSVGKSVADICARFPERFEVIAVAAHSNADALLGSVRRFGARFACLFDPPKDAGLRFKAAGAELLAGAEGLTALSRLPKADHVVFAASGTETIEPLRQALSADKDVSLANKESIVAAGPWIMPLVKRSDQLRPLDSEHSAIWQCLRDEPRKNVSKIFLTASGGPFRNASLAEMATVTPEAALKHPVWNMGAKITVDSATLMNKGIECIEAMQLFDLPASRVGALIHPNSLVHGLVVFSDATLKMLLSRPDMRLPAAAALAWPSRLEIGDAEGLAVPPPETWNLEFREPDEARFPCLALARRAGELGGAYPPLLIGADQFAVDAFLKKRISFLQIATIIERALEKFSGSAPKTVEEAIFTIGEGERLAGESMGF